MLEIHFKHAFPARAGGFELRVSLASACRRLALFGPSGSGKTLTLQAVAGLFTPQEAFINTDGQVFQDSARGLFLPARLRELGYLFQDYALFPHLSVRDNIAFPLKTRQRSLRDAGLRERVDELLEAFELAPVAGHYPAGISGGQKQRTALARALAGRPRLLLLDEPFAALDPLLRARVRSQCSRILARFKLPSIIITHDPEDLPEFAEVVSFYRDGANSACYALGDMEKAARNHDAPAELLKMIPRRAFEQGGEAD